VHRGGQIRIIETALNPVTPTLMTIAQARDMDNIGTLARIEGIVTDVSMQPGTVDTILQFTIIDGSGSIIAYMRDYITPGVDLSFIVEGAWVSVDGFASIGEVQGGPDSGTHRIRVRDRNEITAIPPDEDLIVEWLDEVLERIAIALALATDLHDTTYISVLGFDIPVTSFWVTQSEMDGFVSTIDAIEALVDYIIYNVLNDIGNADILATLSTLLATATDLEDAISDFDDIRRPGVTLDEALQALMQRRDTAINLAETLKNNTRISESGSDILTTAFWVTQADKDEFINALAALNSLIDDIYNDLNRFGTLEEALYELLSVVMLLEGLVNDFNDARSPGTRRPAGNLPPPPTPSATPPTAETPAQEPVQEPEQEEEPTLEETLEPPTEEENHEVIQEQLNEGETNIVLTLPEGIHIALLAAYTVEVLVEAEASLNIVSGIVTVTVSTEFLGALLEEESGGFSIRITETIHHEPQDDDEPPIIHDTEPTLFVTAGITILRDGYTVYGVGIPYTITVDMTGFYLDGLNPARIVAMHDGRPLGGFFDPETGLFIINTILYTGDFAIAYVPNLQRIQLQLGSPIITDGIYGGTIAMDTVPLVINNRTMIPIRFIAETLGAEVLWHEATRSVSVIINGRVLYLAVGETILGMDVPVLIMNNRTMVPLRFISEYFGATVNFNDDTREIEIVK
jgi:hypothetical protein